MLWRGSGKTHLQLLASAWEVAQEFCPGLFHRGGEKDENNLHYFLLSPYSESTERKSSDNFYDSDERS